MLVTDVWKDQPGDYFCISTKDHKKRWQDHFFERKQFKHVKRFIKKNLDKDIYWCPHGFSKPRRLKDYAVMPFLLWADLDEADPSTMSPMPTIAWQSSPGRYAACWVTTEEITESLNRRLTYEIGADHGGWDITQVLRVWGTSNYKYPNAPKVKLLWNDGPEYDIEEIEAILPEDKNNVAEASFGDAHQIFKRYEKRLSVFARKNLLGGKPKPGKRSEVLWRLGHEMIEAGMTQDEAFAVLRVSPWNKFAGRRNGDKQLKRELDKGVQQKLQAAPVENREDVEEDTFLTIPLSEVEEEQMDWLWYPYLARRELTILEGDPGLGKSYLAQMIGKAIVDGRKLPTVKAHKPAHGVVAYFDMENSAGTVTKRRLIDNKCKNLKNYFQEERPFRIDDEDALDAVYDALERLQPDLVVFDTINTYIGKADTHKASETTQAMGHFVEIAKRFNCSVLVLRHLTKSSKEKALYRGQGSIAQTGAARVVITVGQHPDEEDTKVMAVTKLNVTRRPKALTFEILGLPDTLKHQDRSKFVWGDFVDITSDEIVVVSPNGLKKKRGEEIEELLQEILSGGPLSWEEVRRAAEARGFPNSKKIRVVAKEIGIVRKTEGFGKSRVAKWALPTGDRGKDPRVKARRLKKMKKRKEASRESQE